MYKKIFALVLVMAMVLSLSACGKEPAPSKTGEPSQPSDTQAAPETPPESDYPKSPIKVIVPFAAGGGTDLFARIICEKMGGILGQSMEVVNVPGGSATIGATQVVDAAPDGYTLGLCVSTPLALMPLYGETTYDQNDLSTICVAYQTLQGIFVPADSEIQTYEDWIAYCDAQASKGTVKYGGTGIGNFQHLTILEFVKQLGAGWNLEQVAYGSDADQAVAMMSGEIPFCTNQVHAMKGYVEAGQIRPILIFAQENPGWIQDGGYEVKNLTDLGYTTSLNGFIGFWGPKGIGDDVIAAIDSAFLEAVEDQEVLEAIANIGLEVHYEPADVYAESLNGLAAVSENLLKELGMI